MAAGVDKRVMRHARSSTELKAYTTLGSLVLLTASMAWISGYFFISFADSGTLTVNIAYAIGATLWSLAILIIDRALVSLSVNPVRLPREIARAAASGGDAGVRAAMDAATLADGASRSRGESFGAFIRVFLASIPRLLLAIVIALLVAEPILLWFYRDEIDDRISSVQAAAFQVEVVRINAEAEQGLALYPEPMLDRDGDGKNDAAEIDVRIADLEAEKVDKEAEVQRELQLAKQANDGVVTDDENEPVLDKRTGCGSECESHKLKAQNAQRRADEISGAITTLEQTKATLPIPRRGDGAEAQILLIEAERTCKVLQASIQYARLEFEAADANQLKSCFGRDVAATDERFKAALDGVLVREDILGRLSECDDPFGLSSMGKVTTTTTTAASAAGSNTTTTTVGTPTTAPPQTTAASSCVELAEPADDSISARASGVFADLVPGNTTLGRRVGLLRLFLILIDIIAIIYKGVLSMRVVRPYESWEAVDKAQSMDRVIRSTFRRVSRIASDLSAEAGKETIRRIDRLRPYIRRVRWSRGQGYSGPDPGHPTSNPESTPSATRRKRRVGMFDDG